jgi:hypothetical protein
MVDGQKPQTLLETLNITNQDLYPNIYTIDSDVKKRLKNKLCLILCQDKAFEDKMNCQFQRVS